MNQTQLKELLLQSLVHEKGGVLVYKTALEAVLNDDLRQEWQKYLGQTEKHVGILANTCQALGIDPGEMTPGCQIVQNQGKALVISIKAALAANNPIAAELVACECVLLAETKDHADWELLSKCAEALDGEAGAALKSACEAVEPEEDKHLYHTQGWARELWLKSLGLEAQLPPPEEEQDVTSAAEAQHARESADS